MYLVEEAYGGGWISTGAKSTVLVDAIDIMNSLKEDDSDGEYRVVIELSTTRIKL